MENEEQYFVYAMHVLCYATHQILLELLYY